MNSKTTHFHEVRVSVEAYSDGVYNLTIRRNNLREEKIEVSKEEAERICNTIDVELPEAEAQPPEKWG